MVELGAVAAIRPGDAGGEQRYLESEGKKERGEGSVEFVAETAAAFVDDLLKERIVVTDDFAAQVDVEVFKGHREEVSAMDFSQGFWRGSGWASVVDAAQVRGTFSYGQLDDLTVR